MLTFFKREDTILCLHIYTGIDITPQCLKMAKKSRIQHCERSELRLHFEWTKVHEKSQACGQIVLPDGSLLIGQQLKENAEFEKTKMRHFVDFQTL